MITQPDDSAVTTISENDQNTAAKQSSTTASSDLTNKAADPKKKLRHETVRLPETHVGGRINRFLLCSIVSQSARRLKASRSQSNESASVTMIGRGVLRSYLKAALDVDGPLADSIPDIARLGLLNKRIVEDQVLGQAQKRVEEIRVRQGESRRSGDETRIKSDQSSLLNAIAYRDWLEHKMSRG